MKSVGGCIVVTGGPTPEGAGGCCDRGHTLGGVIGWGVTLYVKCG